MRDHFFIRSESFVNGWIGNLSNGIVFLRFDYDILTKVRQITFASEGDDAMIAVAHTNDLRCKRLLSYLVAKYLTSILIYYKRKF